jgi:hypothetical protein
VLRAEVERIEERMLTGKVNKFDVVLFKARWLTT